MVVSSWAHGFNLDSLAIEELVKITESIFADYRLQARADATLGQILAILDIFSETGWPRALRLVWRPDEVYRQAPPSGGPKAKLQRSSRESGQFGDGRTFASD